VEIALILNLPAAILLYRDVGVSLAREQAGADQRLHHAWRRVGGDVRQQASQVDIELLTQAVTDSGLQAHGPVGRDECPNQARVLARGEPLGDRVVALLRALILGLGKIDLLAEQLEDLGYVAPARPEEVRLCQHSEPPRS